MASNIPVIVQGNSFSLAIPLQIYYINGDQMDLQDYTPDPTDEVSVQLKGSRRNYTYTPTIDGNVANIDLSGNELADNYSVVVSIVKANGQRLRSFRTDQFFIVESSDDLTTDDIVQGLEENVIYLNSSIFVAGEDGRGIESIVKTGTSGLVDTYTITYTDATTSTFNVTNGANGAQGAQGADGVGITSIEKTATVGLVDTYTITLSNGETSTFDVTNGRDGVDLGLATIVNDLTTGGTTDVLSAEMGKVLGERTVMRKVLSAAICTMKGYFNASGAFVENNFHRSILISLANITRLDVTGCRNNLVWFYESDGTTPLQKTNDVVLTSFPAGAYYVGVSYDRMDTTAITIDYDLRVFIDEVENGPFKYTRLTAPTGPWNLEYDTGVQKYDSGIYGVLGFIPLMSATLIYCPQNDGKRGVICFYDENYDYITGYSYCRFSAVPTGAKYAKIRCHNVDVGGVAEIYLYEGADHLHDHIAHLEREVSLLKPMPLVGKTVAFLGDSITATYSGQYVSMFAARTGCTIERLAVAGVSYANGGIASQAANLTGNEALVVVMGGTNDFGHGDPIGNIYDESGGTIVPTTDTSTTCSGVHAVIQGIYAKCPTAKIIVITPPQRSTGWTANTQGKYLYEYVDAIKKVAQLYGVLVVDQFANCNINPVFAAMNSKYFNSGGTHPNNLYHQLLADWLYNAIADWIREPYL